MLVLASVAFGAADSPIYNAVQSSLVESGGKRLKKFDAATLAPVKYYGIYYSAEWCGPCRAFTPDLVRWYNQTKPNNPQFELIFVSSDQSEEQMALYMKEDHMPWPALDFDKVRSKRELTKYAGNGIPCLVLIDDQGKVLSDSFVNGQYVGPQKVLDDIAATLKKNPATAADVAAAKSPSASAGGSSFDSFFKKK